ncbi:hypothetical protein Hanom_Chr11g01013751 [Helianthus anomalus]
MIIAMFGRKRAKTFGEGSSSGASSSSGDRQLYRQDWTWEEFKNSRSASSWNDNKKKALSKYKNKKLEAKMWKWKMVTGVSTSVPERIVCERAVNVEEYHTIGITQRFEELGWERVLDRCEDITSWVYLAVVCEWLSTLRFVNDDEPAPMW